MEGKAVRVGDVLEGKAVRAGDVLEGKAVRVGDVLEGKAVRAGDVLEGKAVRAGREKGVKEMREQGIIVVSFGTSYNDSREATIGAIERTIAEEFPEFSQYRAFTSKTIIDKLKQRDGMEFDHVEKALKRAERDGVKRLVVQPTHFMDGFEYKKVKKVVETYQGRFEKMILAKPLLAEEKDYQAVAKAVMEATSSYNDGYHNGETAVCLMGHGTEAEANQVYLRLQEEFRRIDCGIRGENKPCRYFIGTVEATPTIKDVIAAMEEQGIYHRVVLEPLMVVSGDHANHDMAGEKEGSWKRILETKGYQVECILKGLGEFPAIRDIYVAHVRAAVEEMIG